MTGTSQAEAGGLARRPYGPRPRQWGPRCTVVCPQGHGATPCTIGICEVFVKGFSALSQPPCTRTKHMII